MRLPETARSPVRRVGRLAGAIVFAVAGSGCLVGPSYRRPSADTAGAWIESNGARAGGPQERWWRMFDDAALDELVERAYRENLSLRAAGLRVIQAQARRGVAIGGLFPQTQQVSGDYTRTRISENGPTRFAQRDFDTFAGGLDVAWELDVWGRFRRGIEASDADLLAAVASYDDVLVSLVAEVATTYVGIRVLDERLRIAEDNVRVQREALEIARVRFAAGGTSELDFQQATTLLANTEARIPQLQIQRREAEDSLAVLLGVSPAELAGTLTESNGIPGPPLAIAVGIPADLLWRRPDVRAAERGLAAQSARIGVATADLFPHVQLSGTVGLSAEEAADLFAGRSLAAVAGPRFDWPVLNYGRLINVVRVQDAAFQEQVALYQSVVLQAQREVEDALAGYLRGAEVVASLTRSAVAAGRAVDISLIQYREGAADFSRVLDSQQSKLLSDDALALARGSVTVSAITLFRALGGGWELREDDDFVPEHVKAAMRERTWWGGTLDHEARRGEVHEAAADTAAGRPWWRPRWWWPRW
jgi:NodT family efflux transporter outer membrane factor (OMF) lipoprotein